MAQFPTPPGLVEPLPGERKKKNVGLIILLIAVPVVLLTCVGATAVGVFVLVRAAAPPENIAVTIEAPATVAVGDTFTITVLVENEAAHTQELNSIDIYDSFTKGVGIQSSTPRWDEVEHILNFTSYYYETDIMGGGSMTVTFNVTALQPGSSVGDLDICINNEMSCIYEQVQTLVTSN